MSGPQPSTGTPSYREPNQIGRYRIVREIARSNDIIWEAQDPQMNRRIAVKELSLPHTLTGQARRDRIERFYREARAAGALSHESIVTIYEVGEDHGRFFIAMEYLEGQTLRERLAMGGAMPLQEAVDIISALCDALEYAHAGGVIHRDIKPDNVHLLPSGRVKLTDFGIARITHEDALTVDGQVFGTPSYMSPEQVIGKQIDSRSDIFALGVLLFEMLSGRKPFTSTGDSVVTITYRIMNEPTPPMPQIPAPLAAVVQRAMAKKPENRFSSAAAMRVALQAAARSAAASGAAASGIAASPQAMAGSGQEQTRMVAPQRTLLYGDKTHFSTAPGLHGAATDAEIENTLLPSAPASAPGDLWASRTMLPQPPSENPATRPQSPGSRAPLIVALLVVGIALLGGTFALSRAYQSFQVQSRFSALRQDYDRAVALYRQKDYQASVALFERVRKRSDDGPLRTNATLMQAYSCLGLGEAAKLRGDFPTARGWYEQAIALAPNDAHVQEHWANLSAAERGGSTETDRSNSGETALSTPPLPPSDRAESETGASPAPANLTAQDFNAANSQAAARAQQFLQQGDTAWQRGDQAGAVKFWSQATQAGPGSSAAQWALDRMNNINNSVGGSGP